ISFDYRNDGDKNFELQRLYFNTSRSLDYIYYYATNLAEFTNTTEKIDNYIGLLKHEYDFSNYLFSKTNEPKFALRTTQAATQLLLSYLKKARITRSFDLEEFNTLLDRAERLCALTYFSSRVAFSPSEAIPVRRECFRFELALPFASKDFDYADSKQTV